jgi:hypothetical protein
MAAPVKIEDTQLAPAKQLEKKARMEAGRVGDCEWKWKGRGAQQEACSVSLRRRFSL